VQTPTHPRRSQKQARREGGDGKGTDGWLLGGMHACTGSCAAPTCLDKFMARHVLQGEAGAGKGVVGIVREDGEATGAPNRGSIRKSGREAEAWWAEEDHSESETVSSQEVGSVSNQMEAGRHSQE
jgi:hypothetical protein